MFIQFCGSRWARSDATSFLAASSVLPLSVTKRYLLAQNMTKSCQAILECIILHLFCTVFKDARMFVVCCCIWHFITIYRSWSINISISIISTSESTTVQLLPPEGKTKWQTGFHYAQKLRNRTIKVLFIVLQRWREPKQMQTNHSKL